jgi:acyl-coenzyme A synthetase/AMP-(fatty) acid ligase
VAGPPKSAGVPLARAGSLAEAIAYLEDRTITVADYLGEVAALASRLPARSHVVNLCTDRYRFTVAFGAALARGQVSLLPPQRTPDFLSRLARAYPGLYGLSDAAEGGTPIETLAYPELPLSSGTDPEIPHFPANQLAAIAFTSGTTGDPTPHAKPWGALARGAVAESRALGLDRLPGAALVGTVPPQHMYGLESTVVIVLQNRLAMFGGRPFYPADVRAALARVPAPRVLITTPVHLRALELDDTRVAETALILSATAPLSTEAAERAEARFGAPVHEIYGFTEAGMVASRRTTDGAAWYCLPDVTVRYDGELWWAEGGHIDTAAAFTDLIEPLDSERFVLRGRRSDVVNVAGKRASLASLNHHLLAIPGVEDAAYHVPEETGAAVSRLAAFVVAPGLSARALLGNLRQRVDPVFLPRPLHFVERLPRDATGKLSRAALVRLAAECAKR